MCNNIKLSREKCKIAQTEIKYMGHIISGKGVRADPDKIRAIREMQYYDIKKPVTISVDSSMSGTGAALLQDNLPVAYASKALTETQQRYSQIEKEMFAVCFGLTRFPDYIYGKQDLTVETDHLPLLGVFKKPLNKCPARLQRMLIKCQKYDFKLCYKRSKELIIADELSRAFLETKDVSNWDNDMAAAYVNLIVADTEINDKKRARQPRIQN